MGDVQAKREAAIAAKDEERKSVSAPSERASPLADERTRPSQLLRSIL